MRVLVTRPKDDAGETVGRLAARGHEAIVAPLLEIRFRDGVELELEGVQAVLITSANGIRALARRTRRRDAKVFAVGTHSAEAARALGFLDVQDASGNAETLARMVTNELAPDGGVLFHPAGVDTRGDLAGKLSAQGFNVRSETLYDAVAPDRLPRAAKDALSQNALDAALFFSPRTARIFVELVERAGLASACQNLRALCISEATVDELRALRFREIRAAARPNLDDLIALLG